MFNSGNSTPFTMPVTPAYGNGGGMGGWGNDWIALAILALIFGDGWGMGGMGGMGMFLPFMFMNGGFGGFGGNGCGCGNGNSNAIQADIQRGFDTQSIIGKLDGINNGLCDGFYAANTSILNAQSGIQNSLCQGFNGVNTNIMQGNFGLQQAINNASVANMQGQNALQSQLASCCCETQRAIDGVNYNMATNTCAITNQMNNNTRDIIESNNAGTRAILDYLCQDKISTLQSENQALRLAASQANQNNVLMAAMDSNKAEILRKTGAECPTAAYIVQPPQPVTFPTNCCGGVNYAGYGNNGCGCNSGCC